ncbi:MAG: LysM peptidoglycan-binding domain-containing protein [Bacteroidales bacterium]|nr:LysM peptidoglycan-binding domain-containing protein [Candidatus Cryptobacteroides faecihippi]
MKRRLISTILPAIMMLCAATAASAQGYSNPGVTVSKEKVRSEGKVYYSHIVQEKQTLFSITKAYNVPIEEIYAANRALHLETEGLKAGQILLIPIKDETSAGEETVQNQDQKVKDDGKGDHFYHRVKWFEDLGAIAQKYNVSKKSIMNINGMTSEKLERKQMLKIPYNPAAWEDVAVTDVKPVVTEPEGNDAAVQEETEPEAKEEEKKKGIGDYLEDIFSRAGKNEINVNIALPLNSQKTANQQMMDFYCGALLASKDLSRNGVKLDLSVYDIAGGAMPITREKFAESDFTIGPVANSDIMKAVASCNGESWIISPLDPKAEAIADTVRNVIHTPTSVGTQIHDMMSWIKEDMKNGDKVIVITQKGGTVSSYTRSILDAVNMSGIGVSTISFNVLEGRNIMTTMSNAMNASGSNRIIVASDNKPFVMEAVRNIFLVASSKKVDVQLYGTAKLRTFEGNDGLDIAQMHSINTHISCAYFVDYDSKDVQSFLYQYRALYNTEPSPSAFQGYDVLSFFTTLSQKHGSKLQEGERIHGLQSDLKLKGKENGGYVNSAVRRVLYAPDYTVRVIR